MYGRYAMFSAEL